MATLSVPYSFIDATAIVATEMNSNFAAVKTFAEGISAGTNIDTGAVDTSKLSAATIQLLAPTGSVTQFAGATVPTGWILCDGSAVSQVTYSALFTVIGSSFNTSGGQAAPAAGTFRVPILSGRIPVGRDASNPIFDVLGETGGSETVTLGLANLPSHQHSDGTLTAATVGLSHQHGDGTLVADSNTHSHSVETTDAGGSHYHGATTTTNSVGSHGHGTGDSFSAASGSNITGAGTAYTSSAGSHDHTFDIGNGGSHGHGVSGSTSLADPQHSHDVTGVTGLAGSGTAHDNIQPYIVLNYIIKA